MLNVNTKLRWCTVFNTCLLIFMTIPVVVLNDGSSKYFRWGWHEDLTLISVPINTQKRYWMMMLFISVMKITHVVIGEIAHPILGFNIYNPDKKEIEDFTKGELQAYGNIMYLIEGFKDILTVMLSITQIDIALASMLVANITSVFTIRSLLNEKIFSRNSGNVELYEVIVNQE